MPACLPTPGLVMSHPSQAEGEITSSVADSIPSFSCHASDDGQHLQPDPLPLVMTTPFFLQWGCTYAATELYTGLSAVYNMFKRNLCQIPLRYLLDLIWCEDLTWCEATLCYLWLGHMRIILSAKFA